ncbi:MAG: phosphate ABC transporter substrate-binding protein [Gammaproteobacteria bacterium]|nr:phosphate ABC transporter substrate-binding protein [Gammaproteobacteria bacterium]
MKSGFVALVALSIPFLATAGEIKYEGSSTVGKYISDASSVCQGSKFKIKTASESSGGEKCPVRSACDIGGVARDVNQKFVDKGVHVTLIGKDAIAAVVNESNPVTGLTAAQLKDIFTGKTTNWSQVGGPDLAISTYIVKKGSATRKVFRKVVLGGDDYAGTKVITPDAKIVTTVGRNPGAIGQISFAFLTEAKGVRPLDVDGQQASVENSSYPITRPLHLTAKGAPSGATAEFIDWTLSSAGQAVVKQRFVAVK